MHPTVIARPRSARQSHLDAGNGFCGRFPRRLRLLGMTETGRSACGFSVMEPERSRAADSRPYARTGTQSVIYQRFSAPQRVGDGFPVPPLMFDAVLGGVIARRRRRRGNLDSMPVLSLRDPVRGRGNLRQKSLAASFGDRRVTAFLAMTRTGRSARKFFS